MEKKTKRLFYEKCGGGQCSLRQECFLHLIPRDLAVNNVIKTQVKKAGDKCGDFRRSSVSEVLQEIRLRKQEVGEFDYLVNK